MKQQPLFRYNAGSARREGSALITVLWVLGLLAMLVSSFAFEAHIESRLTSFYRSRTKAEYLARSGLDMAELLVHKSNRFRGQQRDPEGGANDIWYDLAFTLTEGGTVSFTHDISDSGVGEGLIHLSITPEPARRNVNQLIEQIPENDEAWELILDVGGIPVEMWPTLIDSFYDWTDEDDEPLPDGAETADYYALLDPPYRAKNGPLDTVGELSLVRGFSNEILNGGVLREGLFEGDEVIVSGIADMLTTYGDGKVNINAASERVLRTLPDVDAELAQFIVAHRESWVDDMGEERTGFRDLDEFFHMIPEFPPRARELVTTESSIYRITSTGDLNGVLHTIWCIVNFSNDRFVVLRWREDD